MPSILTSILASHPLPRQSLAEQMDVSLQTIHNWCSGRVPVPVHHIDRLAERLRHVGVGEAEIGMLVAAQLSAHGLSDRLIDTIQAKGDDPRGHGTVMIMVWDIKSGGMFSVFAHSCREAIEALGYACVVVDCGGAHQMKHTYVKEAIRHHYAGVVLVGVPGSFPDPNDDILSTIDPLVTSEVPTVMVTPWRSDIRLPQGVAGVGWDADATNERALSTLFEWGHEDVAILLSGTGTMVLGRYQGMDRSFERLGRKLNEDLLVWVDGDHDDIPETSRVVRSATAVFGRASTLPTLTNACYTQGLQWPTDISVITVAQNQSLPHLGTNPFTFVAVPARRISQGAAQLLASLASGEQGPYSQQFIVYGSSSLRVINEEGGSIGAPAARPVATTN